MIFLWFSERCHGNMCNLNVIVVLEFISRDLYLLFAIRFSSKFQNSVFYQHMRPKSGFKFPRPFKLLTPFCDCTGRFVSDLVRNPNCWFFSLVEMKLSSFLNQGPSSLHGEVLKSVFSFIQMV